LNTTSGEDNPSRRLGGPIRILATILILSGVALFVYGLLDFRVGIPANPDVPTPPSYFYDEEGRVEASVGAALVIAGYLVFKSKADKS